MTEIKTQNENVKSCGKVQIANEVLAIIAGTAALEVEGIVGATSTFAHNISEFLGMKDFAKGVKVEVEGEEVNVELNVLVKYGYRIPDTTEAIQKKVKTAIETMTGLIVTTININVTGLSFEKEKKETKELAEE